MMDIEDRREAAARAARIRKLEEAEQPYGNPPEPLTADEVAEREAVAQRAAAYRAKQHERAKIVGQARRAAAEDRAQTDADVRTLARVLGRDHGLL